MTNDTTSKPQHIADAFDKAWQAQADKRQELVKETPEIAAAMSQIGQTEKEFKNSPELTRDAAVSTVASKLRQNLESGIEIPEARQATSENIIAPSTFSGQLGKDSQQKVSQEIDSGKNPLSNYYKMEHGNFTEYRDAETSRRAFIDTGQSLTVTGQANTDIAAAIQVAKDRQWSAIQIEGSPGFKREAYAQAQNAGLEVVGYKPDRQANQRVQEIKSDEIKTNQKQRGQEIGY